MVVASNACAGWELHEQVSTGSFATACESAIFGGRVCFAGLCIASDSVSFVAYAQDVPYKNENVATVQ